MKIILNCTPQTIERHLQKHLGTTKTHTKNTKIVEGILADVKKNKDRAIKKYELKLGGSTISSLRVSPTQISAAYTQVSKKEISAIRLAKQHLAKTEIALKKQFAAKLVVSHPSTTISKSFVPIDSVGCYIPGGSAQYPSSAIMSITTAKIAGVPRIVAVSPPDRSGNLDPLTIVASDICGATEIYKTGGAQAIAALAYGTPTIKRVHKIVGPGGAFVTLAKHLVSNTTAIDMMAGPTELGIIIITTTTPKNTRQLNLAVLDLISQAEHSADTNCYILTNSVHTAKTLQRTINTKLKDKLGGRADIIRRSLNTNGFIAVCKNTNTIIDIANILAPEHLQILDSSLNTSSNNNNRGTSSSTTPPKWTKIKNAGVVLLGDNTPSAASDYLLGSNHILPTNGFGKTRGPLSVLDFLKILTKVKTTKKGLSDILDPLQSLTTSEGLPNHYTAVRSRIHT